MNKTYPIGIFDSGVGGLSLAKCINHLLPNEQIIYFADQLHLPYGTKSSEFLSERALEVCEHLVQYPVKSIVVACNTATSTTINLLREKFSCPIFGIEPGIKPAAEQSRKKRVGVMATTQTLESDSFKKLLARFSDQAEFICQACTGLAHSIELKGRDPETLSLLKQFITPLTENNIDTLVLGCTHYAHVYNDIQAIAGDHIQVIEPSMAVCRHVKTTLKNLDLLNDSHSIKKDVFLSSHSNHNSSTLIQELWKNDLKFDKSKGL